MKFSRLLSVVTTIGLVVALSCQTEKSNDPGQISTATLSKIQALGFRTQGVYRADGGYIVEGDIYLTDKDLSSIPNSPRLLIAKNEQYHTFWLVTGLPRVITISSASGLHGSVSVAIDDAIARYNAENLGITFKRVVKGGEITVTLVRRMPYIAQSGFPSYDGHPYTTINFNKDYASYSPGFLATVIAHELGHCIGFRHTDYMDRSYSCGTGGSEGRDTTGLLGAVNIPGTPIGPDAGSWMLACMDVTTDRPFNTNDIIALHYLY